MVTFENIMNHEYSIYIFLSIYLNLGSIQLQNRFTLVKSNLLNNKAINTIL